MDRTSLEDINKGKRNFLIAVLGVAVVIGTVVGLFTTYKTETLVCSKIDDICSLEKINLLNMKNKSNLIKMSDIKYATYIPQRVAGNMYARGYSSYYLAFYTKNKTTVKIFTNDYYQKDDIDEIISDLNKKLKSDDMVFQITQKL